MLAQWHLSDRRGGVLLFSAFAGSTTGALLVHGRFRAMAAVGLAAAAAATLIFSLSVQSPFLAAFLLYGIGLGVTMTAISLLRSREVSPSESNLELNRLNLLWAVGASCAPVLALRSLRLVSVNMLFRYESMTLLLACVAVLLSMRRGSSGPGAARTPAIRHERLAPLRMCVFAGAAVGLETAIGSWLTTYAERVAHGAGIAVSANSAFWLGLLLSRGAHSTRPGQRLQRGWGVAGHLAAVSCATILLIVIPSEVVLPLAGLLAGLGLGPLYPLVLSRSLPHFRSGAVFVTAGVGAALVPWCTGALSTSLHSLRAGLIAPCATVGILLASALWMRREISDPHRVSG